MLLKIHGFQSVTINSCHSFVFIKVHHYSVAVSWFDCHRVLSWISLIPFEGMSEFYVHQHMTNLETLLNCQLKITWAIVWNTRVKYGPWNNVKRKSWCYKLVILCEKQTFIWNQDVVLNDISFSGWVSCSYFLHLFDIHLLLWNKLQLQNCEGNRFIATRESYSVNFTCSKNRLLLN